MQNCDAGMGSIALQGSITDVRPYGYLNARYSGHGIAPADMLTVSDGGVYAIIFFLLETRCYICSLHFSCTSNTYVVAVH